MGENYESPLSKLMLGLEDAAALDVAVRAIDPLLDAISANSTINDLLQGRWFGHALHPAIVLIPAGAWISATVLDFTGADPTGAAAHRLVKLGNIVTPLAVVTGLAQLHEADQHGKRVGIVHAGLNALVHVLQVSSARARKKEQLAKGRKLSLAAIGLLVGAAYLGGHLSVSLHLATRDDVFQR